MNEKAEEMSKARGHYGLSKMFITHLNPKQKWQSNYQEPSKKSFGSLKFWSEMPAFIEGLKKYLQHVWTKTANKNGDPDRRFEKPLKESPQSPHITTHLLGQVRFLPAYLQKSHPKKTCGREKLARIHKTKQSQKPKHRTHFFSAILSHLFSVRLTASGLKEQ